MIKTKILIIFKLNLNLIKIMKNKVLIYFKMMINRTLTEFRHFYKAKKSLGKKIKEFKELLRKTKFKKMKI